MAKKDGIYSGTREVHTYADLWHGADVLIEKSEQEERGSYYTVMSALLLTAFTFEAYLNHLGDKTFSFWTEVEPTKVMGKYKILCTHFGFTPDFSKRPYQTVRSLFKFRNAIAHGKSVVLKETKEVLLTDTWQQWGPKAEWEEYSVFENAKRAKEDIARIIEELHLAAGLGDYPFVHGTGSGSLSKKLD